MRPIERRVAVDGLPASQPWAYAQVVAAGDLVFVAGQAGLDERGDLVSPEFVPQARRTFENIERALHAVGCGLHDIVAMTVFLTDWRHGAEFARVRAEHLGEHLAASAMVAVSQLAHPGMLVEVQCVAVRPAR